MKGIVAGATQSTTHTGTVHVKVASEGKTLTHHNHASPSTLHTPPLTPHSNHEGPWCSPAHGNHRLYSLCLGSTQAVHPADE